MPSVFVCKSFLISISAKQPYNQEEVIATYKALIRRMPRANQYLLLYVLDLLSVFARKSDKNLMTATSECLTKRVANYLNLYIQTWR